MLQLLLFGAIFAILFYYYAIKPMTYWKERGVRQGRKVWLLGDSWRTVFRLESIAEMMSRVYNQVPGVRYSGIYQFMMPTLLIKDPELIKLITVKDFDHFLDHRTFIPENVDPLAGKNLFALRGQKWRDMRSILSPSFTSSKMKFMFVLMSECAENFTKYFLKQNQDLIEIEMKDTFTRYTNDVIGTTAFGISTNSLENPTNDFFMMGKEASDFSDWRKVLKFFGYMMIPKILEIFKISLFGKNVREFFENTVNLTIKTRQEKGIIRPDLIHLLMEAQKQPDENVTVNESDKENSIAKKPLTNIEIVAQAMIFFLAGFDTVSGLMCFMAHELAIHPEIQTRLRDEINEALEEGDGKVSYETLNKMKYMDMIIAECLRKWPNAIMTDRICTKPYTIQPVTPDEKSVHLEEGNVVLLPIFAIHRDPEIYPDPERFDPERFSDENKDKINPYLYMPFGVGPRSCIGNRFALLETKVVMFHLLSNFEIVPTAKTTIPLKISKKQLNLNSEDGFWMGLKRIHK